MLAKAAPVTGAQYLLVMGVSGVGKSTVGNAIARRIGACLVEADHYHPIENIQLMSSGHPLTDDRRWPWLQVVAQAAADAFARTGGPVVVACSALKRRYRDFLRARLGPISILHLSGPADLIRLRLEKRDSHFMPPRLLESQLADLEELQPSEGPITLIAQENLEQLVTEACRVLGLRACETIHQGGFE